MVLKTAMQPKWIAMLLVAMVLATVFVVLSAWQFGASQVEDTPDSTVTETPQPLTELHEPEQPMTVAEADHIVTFSGEFVEETEVLISERINNGDPGYWSVGAFRVDGAPADEVIPVVLGWVEDPGDAGPLPATSNLEVEGRLLPPEAPEAGAREQPGVFPTLSVAELINIWDEPSYSGFVVAFEVTDPSGVQVGAQAEDSALDPVWVGPQPEAGGINWLNLFYAVEWVVFAGFAFYLWWRLVKDAHEKEREAEQLDREWEEQWRQEYLVAKEAGQSDEEAQQTATEQAAQKLENKERS